MPSDSAVTEEDAKLVTLARGARARIGAEQGAAVRDEMGRTYSGASVQLGSLRLSALQLAVAQAYAAGATGLECAVILGTSSMSEEPGLGAIRDFCGTGVPVIYCGPDGLTLGRSTT